MSVNRYNSITGELEKIAGGTLYADAPIGTIQAYGGTTAPSGWLLCQGQAISRTTYAELFAVIGISFGAGDDSTTFNIPDLRETVPVGIGENSTATIAEHDTYTLGEFKDDQLKDHYHGIQTNGVSDQYTINPSKPNANTSGVKGWGNPWGTQFNPATVTHGKQLGVNYIIKAKQVTMPADFIDGIDDVVDDALSAFSTLISLQSVNNSTITYNKSRIVGGLVTICADIIVQSGSYLVKENAIANVPNYGTDTIGYILPCIYRNTANGLEEPGYALVSASGNIFPYYTKTEYNEIRINASYSSKN